MKNCTDLKQSKHLSEFLSPESADICYKCIGEDPYDVCLRPYSEWREEYKGLLVDKEVDVVPCWSLTALMDVLDRGALFKTPKGWACQTYTDVKAITSDYYGNPIDACVAMIENLHEQKLL